VKAVTQKLFKLQVSSFVFFLFLFFSVVLGFELKASDLLCRHSYYWSHAPSPFCFSNFFIGSHVFAGDYHPHTYGLLHSWYYRCVPPHPVYLLRWGLTFSPSWPLTLIFPISASKVAGITGVSHYSWPGVFKLFHFFSLLGFLLLSFFFHLWKLR
jgi:hypothetical protein